MNVPLRRLRPLRLLPLLPLLLPLLLAACSMEHPPYTESVGAYGAPVVFTVYGMAQDDARAAVANAVTDMKFIERATDPLRPGPMERTNELLAATGEFSANPSLLPLIRQAQQLAQQSHGLFNPALGQLLALWGFEREVPQGPPPPAERIAALAALHPSMDDIHIKGIRMRSSNGAVRLDFGDYGRGYALDAALARLHSAGVRTASLITADAAARIGQRMTVSFRIDGVDGTPLARVDLRPNEVAYTVSTLRRSYVYQGTRYYPVINPATGQPAPEVISVTVFGDSLARAAAEATALFVAGPDHWSEAAQQMCVTRGLLVDAEQTVHITPGLRGRVAVDGDGEAPVVDGL